MQAIKDKFNDMSAMRKAKAEAKEEEKAEKELAKTRVEVAREVRLAKEAEAEMDLHVHKAAQKIANEEKKHIHEPEQATLDPYASTFTNTTGGDPHANTNTTGRDPHANTHLNNAETGPTNKLL